MRAGIDAPTFPTLQEVLPEIRRVLDGAEHIVCLAHKDADADSLGSALAFAAVLRAIGRTPHPVVPEPKPYLLEFLPGYELLETAPERVDAVFAFDCATTNRFAEKRVLVESRDLPVVNVDHHVSNTLFGTVNLVQPDASASGQVVYRLLTALGAPIPAEAATNLYAALLTDTGGFRHENTTEAALRLGADLVALGADAAWVALKSYKSKPPTMARLEALSVSAMRAELGGRLVWSEVTRAMLETAGADMVQSEGVIDELQSIDGIKVALLFKELSDGVTKISVRSRDEIDATAIAVPFGGGGHQRAAGAELPVGLAEARERVLPLVRSLVEGT